VSFLNDRGFKIKWEKAKYSLNRGFWGTRVGGAQPHSSEQPLPEEDFQSQAPEQNPQTIPLSFENGKPSPSNGTESQPVELIQTLDELASSYAIGRDIHVGDTIIGIKGRVGFEAAAAILIIKAHEQLEKHTLTKWQIHWKAQLGDWYGMMLHEAQYLDPVM